MTNDAKPLSEDELNIERHRAGSCWGLQDACGRVVGLLATIDALQAELAERDRQLLALREALAALSASWQDMADKQDRDDVSFGKELAFEQCIDDLEQALSDTTAAGRQAELRVIERFLHTPEDQQSPEVKELMRQCTHSFEELVQRVREAVCVKFDLKREALSDTAAAGREAELRVIERYVKKVNARAEENMLKTGKLEGAHHAAMKAELEAMREEVKEGRVREK